MVLIRCNNGHYYDSSKFSTCPYCNVTQESSNVTVPFENPQRGPKMVQCAKGHYYDSSATSCPFCSNEAQAADVTVPLGQNIPIEAHEPAVQMPAAPVQDCASHQWRPPESAAPLNTQNMPEDDNRTVSYYSRIIGSEPVVGWLVCIKGEYFGECFKLKSGRNFIGRSPEMDIQLSMDFAVSRQKHAVIIYEPKARIFIAQPGESRELFYLNDEVVLSNATLKQSDVIMIGETKLMFIPLCGKQFSWDDVAEK